MSMLQVLDSEDETQCVHCPAGTLPDANQKHCKPLPEVTNHTARYFFKK